MPLQKSILQQLTKIKKIDFGWAKFDLIFEKEIDKPSPDETLYGESDLDKYCIKICTDQPEEVIKETIIHEVLHVILNTVGLEDTIAIEEETLVLIISRGILSFVKLNGKLAELVL
jgi:hypothetical protein